MKRASAEIDMRIPPEGSLMIPKRILKRLNVDGGTKVHIRITGGMLSSSLKRRNVTEEEIDQIAFVQMEPRENVVRFLVAESRFSGNAAFKRRARAMKEML